MLKITGTVDVLLAALANQPDWPNAITETLPDCRGWGQRRRELSQPLPASRARDNAVARGLKARAIAGMCWKKHDSATTPTTPGSIRDSLAFRTVRRFICAVGPHGQCFL